MTDTPPGKPDMNSALRRLIAEGSLNSPAAVNAARKLAAGGKPMGVNAEELNAALRKLASPSTASPSAQIRARQAGRSLNE